METENSKSAVSFIFSKLGKMVKKSDTILFLLTFIFMLLVHMFMFTNKFLNHDDIMDTLGNCNFAITSGRWFLQPVVSLSGSFSGSWMIGVMGSIYMSVAVVAIARLFRFKHVFCSALMSLALVSFPVLASVNAYMFSADGYMFALMMAALSALFIHKEKWWSLLLGIVCLTLSLGCYQAYFALTCSLLLIAVGIDILDRRWNEKWHYFIFTALKYIGCLVAAMVFYFIIMYISLAVTGKELVSYKGMDSMGQLTMRELISRSITGYKAFFEFYRDYKLPVFHDFFTKLCAVSVLLSLVTAIGGIVKRKLYRKPILLVWLACVALVFPLSVDLAYVMTGTSVHILMRYPSVLLLVLPAIALDRINIDAAERKKIVSYGATTLAVCLIAVQVVTCGEFMVVTNRAYFTLDMSYKQTEVYVTKLFTRIEMTEGYEKNTPIALVGPLRVDFNYPTTNIIGVPTANDSLNTYSDARNAMFRYVFGIDRNIAGQDVIDAVKETEKFKSMPVYPAEGSVENINGVVVVKLS